MGPNKKGSHLTLNLLHSRRPWGLLFALLNPFSDCVLIALRVCIELILIILLYLTALSLCIRLVRFPPNCFRTSKILKIATNRMLAGATTPRATIKID